MQVILYSFNLRTGLPIRFAYVNVCHYFTGIECVALRTLSLTLYTMY